MKEFINKVEERSSFLKKIVQEKKKALETAPKGILNIATAGNRTQYYLKNNVSDEKKKYMRKDELPLVKKLCQRDYDQKVLALAQKELYQLERLLHTYGAQTCEDVYEHLNIQRKKFVNPIILSDQEFAKEWEGASYEHKSFWEGAPEYYTDKNERVRSKTEILIANALYKHGVPYRYECPLYLSGYGQIHPDFTVLNVENRTEMYWEHLGMMDNIEYAENALQRIDAYQKNDIYPGEKLILTYETQRYPINSRMIEKMIYKYLKQNL